MLSRIASSLYCTPAPGQIVPNASTDESVGALVKPAGQLACAADKRAELLPTPHSNGFAPPVIEFPDDNDDDSSDNAVSAAADHTHEVLQSTRDVSKQCVQTLLATEQVASASLTSAAAQAEKIAGLQVAVHTNAQVAAEATSKSATLRKLRSSWFFTPVRSKDGPTKKQQREFKKKQKKQNGEVYDAKHDVDRLVAAQEARADLQHRSAVAAETAAARRNLVGKKNGGLKRVGDAAGGNAGRGNDAAVVGTSAAADVQMNIDRDVALMSASLGRLKEAATTLGSELDRQTRALGDIALDADETAVSVRVAQRDIRRVLHE